MFSGERRQEVNEDSDSGGGVVRQLLCLWLASREQPSCRVAQASKRSFGGASCAFASMGLSFIVRTGGKLLHGAGMAGEGAAANGQWTARVCVCVQ